MGEKYIKNLTYEQDDDIILVINIKNTKLVPDSHFINLVTIH